MPATAMTSRPASAVLLRTLRIEHRLIRRMLRCLETIAHRVELGLPLPQPEITTCLRFFREFVEYEHRGHEDNFYPALAMEGAREDAAIAGKLVRAHEEDKLLLQALCLFWEPVSELLPEERAGFATTAAAYARRLRRHMDLEERHVHGAIDRLIGTDDQVRLRDEWTRPDARARLQHWTEVVAALERALF